MGREVGIADEEHCLTLAVGVVGDPWRGLDVDRDQVGAYTASFEADGVRHVEDLLGASRSEEQARGARQRLVGARHKPRYSAVRLGPDDVALRDAGRVDGAVGGHGDAVGCIGWVFGGIAEAAGDIPRRLGVGSPSSGCRPDLACGGGIGSPQSVWQRGLHRGSHCNARAACARGLHV